MFEYLSVCMILESLSFKRIFKIHDFSRQIEVEILITFAKRIKETWIRNLSFVISGIERIQRHDQKEIPIYLKTL